MRSKTRRKNVLVSNLNVDVWRAAKRLAVEHEMPVARVVEQALLAFVTAHAAKVEEFLDNKE